jgi:hypothetical protein
MKAGTVNAIVDFLLELGRVTGHEGKGAKEDDSGQCNRPYECMLCLSRTLLVRIHNEEDTPYRS